MRQVERVVRVRAPVPEKLPGLSHFSDHVQIQVGGEHLILVAGRLRDDLSPRIAEIAGTVKLSDIPRLFDAYPVDGPNEIPVGNRMRGLFQFP